MREAKPFFASLQRGCGRTLGEQTCSQGLVQTGLVLIIAGVDSQGLAQRLQQLEKSVKSQLVSPAARIECRIGVASYPVDGDSIQALLEKTLSQVGRWGIPEMSSVPEIPCGSCTFPYRDFAPRLHPCCSPFGPIINGKLRRKLAMLPRLPLSNAALFADPNPMDVWSAYRRSGGTEPARVGRPATCTVCP